MITLLALANNSSTVLARRDHRLAHAVTALAAPEADADADAQPDMLLDVATSRKDLVIAVLHEGTGALRLRGLHIHLLHQRPPP